MIVDEADDSFQRKTVLVHISIASWTRGTPIPRSRPGRAVFIGTSLRPEGDRHQGHERAWHDAQSLHHRQDPAELPEETIEDFPVDDGPSS